VAAPDLSTTGILAATASKVSGTVIAVNHITGNHFGIFLEAARWENGLFRATPEYPPRVYRHANSVIT
jgi:hypothetical protein